MPYYEIEYIDRNTGEREVFDIDASHEDSAITNLMDNTGHDVDDIIAIHEHS